VKYGFCCLNIDCRLFISDEEMKDYYGKECPSCNEYNTREFLVCEYTLDKMTLSMIKEPPPGGK